MAIDRNELAEALGKLELRSCPRRRTAADWTAADEVLLLGEFGLETDIQKVKLDDGVTTLTSLGYWPA